MENDGHGLGMVTIELEIPIREHLASVLYRDKLLSYIDEQETKCSIS